MLNKEIISASIPSLHLNDPVSQALDLMADFHVTHLPVVVEDKLAGLVIIANGQRIEWRRDPVDVYAFHVDVPAGASETSSLLVTDDRDGTRKTSE